jgi:hypothetical protein
MTSPKKQHLVSQVVLRRFVDDDGLLLRVNLEHGNIGYASPAACMYEWNFVAAAPNEAEKLWQTVEDRLPAALAAIDGGAIQTDADSIKILKECLALHFIRSHNTKLVTEASSKYASAKMRDELVTEEKDDLAHQYYKEHHIHLVGKEGLSFAAAKVMATIEPALSSSQEFWERVKIHFEEVKKFLAPLELEMLMPESDTDEFLIGDGPALPYQSGNLMGGFRGGVGLNDANAFYMPVGPRHVVSLARESQQHRLNRAQVGQINETQALNAFKQLCCRPTSRLIVRNVRATVQAVL